MDESIFNPQKKLKRTGFYYGPMALVMMFLVAVLIMSLFFRVSEIEVVNASDYSDREIVAASGIEKGVNLFFVDRFSGSLVVRGLVADVEAALKAVMDVLVNVIGASPAPITRS